MGPVYTVLYKMANERMLVLGRYNVSWSRLPVIYHVMTEDAVSDNNDLK